MPDTPLPEKKAAALTPPVRGKLVPILLAVNSLVAAGALGVVIFRPSAAPAAQAGRGHAQESGSPEGGPGASAEPSAAGGPAGATLKLADFVVRLKNPDADRYVRISFELELSPGQDRAVADPYLPRVRDAFISDLSDRTLEDLQGAEALGQLKRQLMERASALMPAARPRALYITEFILQ